jgi:hypothetical protein
MIKNFKISSVAIVLLFATLFTSCEWEKLEVPVIITDTTPVSFAADIIPIFDASCNMSGCHPAGGVPPDLSPAGAYLNLTSLGYIELDTALAAQSKLYMRMSDGTMPPSGSLPDTIRYKVLNWIKQGALDN